MAEVQVFNLDGQLRDNLLVTMGCRAGVMEMKGLISLPSGVEGEDKLAEFVSEKVDLFLELEEDDEESFDIFIETSLRRQYAKLYAREAPPEQTKSPLDLEDEFWDSSVVVVFGNNRLKGHVPEGFKRLYDNVAFAAECMEDLLDVQGMDHLEETTQGILEASDLLPVKSLRGDYTKEELDRWIELLHEYLLKSSPHYGGIFDREESLSKMYSLLVGQDMKYLETRGCCQGEWNGLYYPAFWTEVEVSLFETEYWNTGTQWYVTDVDPDSDQEPTLEEYFYAHSGIEEEIRQELADTYDIRAENIVLYRFKEWKRTPTYERSVYVG